MGIVYRSRDSRLERDVAVKILSVGLLTNENARRRFRREALALTKLNHANIASVHDVGKQDGSISAKFCSIRHYCFVRGVLGKGADRVGGDDDFRRAFRTLNRLT